MDGDSGRDRRVSKSLATREIGRRMNSSDAASFRDGSEPIEAAPEESAVRVTPSARQAEEWATVLAASRIRHRLVPTDVGWAVVVAGRDGARASAALRAYDRENQAEAHVPAPSVGRHSIALGIAAGALLLAFFAVTGPRHAGVAWFERGSASADHILRGQVWRAVTALTLHADLGHALGNAVACAVLIPPVSQALGPGTGLAVLLLSGMAGNLMTALVHGAPYSSVGASTLTFGAIGVLTAQAIAARRQNRAARRRPWVVIVTSLVLLVLLGTARDADVLAHVFGLASGLVLGLVVALARPRVHSPRREWTLAVAAIAVVLVCWWIA